MNNNEKIQAVLNKGEDITFRDVVYLKSKGLSYVKISKAMGIPNTTLAKYFRKWRAAVEEQGLYIEGLENI